MSAWLRPLALAYEATARVYHGVYDRGLRHPRALPAPVISVGNLSVGGTGKTPIVLFLARELIDRGRQPVILTRGYGGREQGSLLDGMAGDDPARASAFGDEACLLTRRLPGVPVLVNPDRYQAGLAYWEEGGRCDVFILDDGFQHRALHRDLDLVLLDPGTQLKNSNLLPNGPLREPIGALSRAGILLTLGGSLPGPASAIPRGTPCYVGRVIPTGLHVLGRPQDSLTLEDLRGRRVRAVCAIANPDRFRGTLEACGAVLTGRSTYRDHHAFTPGEVTRETEAAERDGAVVVTTEKDAVRLEEGPPWWVLAAGVSLGPERKEFLERVLAPVMAKPRTP